MIDDLEIEAIALGDDPKRLLARLRSTRSCLWKVWRREFTPCKFDRVNKRLVSSSGKFALQWQVRERPDLPPSYNNQQTSQGFVHMITLKKIALTGRKEKKQCQS